MKIHAAPQLSKYTTALGAYNIKSFTYEINQHTYARARARTHTHTHTHHIHTRARSPTHARTREHVVRNSCRGKYARETKTEG